MKYIVITSKHHDGFCLFDSKYTDFDMADATPWGRDVLKPLGCRLRSRRYQTGLLLLVSGLACSSPPAPD